MGDEIMTPEEFNRHAVAATGAVADVTQRVADLLKVNSRTVARWRAGKARIPDGVARELRRRPAPPEEGVSHLRRDRWLNAAGPSSKDGQPRRYIIHRWRPRFIARAVFWALGPGSPDLHEEDVDPATFPVEPANFDKVFSRIEWIDRLEGDVDTATGMVHRANSTNVLVEIEWIDDPPDDGDARTLLDEAAEAMWHFHYDAAHKDCFLPPPGIDRFPWN